jgi:hypothetical protein
MQTKHHYLCLDGVTIDTAYQQYADTSLSALGYTQHINNQLNTNNFYQYFIF